ncbi:MULTISPECIES: anti-sigma factor [unclassified Rhizobium]|uniref:anti-sigma factor n=1 Tax=unclassified Rhizobium TaxID=2613769 RepID=UPI00138EFB73|nr:MULTISPECIES: anti-sigma factor [unclassified Rhizobium]
MTTENAKSGDSRLDQVIAGEYVLGVLSPEDRQKVEARMTLDRNFAAMVDHWRSNMLTVDQTPRPTRRAPRRVSPFAEPLAARPRPQRERVPVFNAAIWNSAAFWRGVACIAVVGLVATGVSQTGLFAASPTRGVATSLPLVAGSDLALTARYDNDSGRLRLAPVAAGASTAGVADAKSIQIWLTPEGSEPVSLGVVNRNSHGEIVVPKAARTRLRDGAPVMVSLEPAGGSPTGAPTGKVLASGIVGR